MKIQILHQQGLSQRAIAKQLGIIPAPSMMLDYSVAGFVLHGAEFHPLPAAVVSIETWQMQYPSSIWYTIT